MKKIYQVRTCIYHLTAYDVVHETEDLLEHLRVFETLKKSTNWVFEEDHRYSQL